MLLLGSELASDRCGRLPVLKHAVQESRKEAMERAEAQATELGANALINVRFATSSVAQGAAEILCYGTAVKVQ